MNLDAKQKRSNLIDAFILAAKSHQLSSAYANVPTAHLDDLRAFLDFKMSTLALPAIGQPTPHLPTHIFPTFIHTMVDPLTVFLCVCVCVFMCCRLSSSRAGSSDGVPPHRRRTICRRANQNVAILGGCRSPSLSQCAIFITMCNCANAGCGAPSTICAAKLNVSLLPLPPCTLRRLSALAAPSRQPSPL